MRMVTLQNPQVFVCRAAFYFIKILWATFKSF